MGTYSQFRGFEFVNNDIRGSSAGDDVIQEAFGGADTLARFESAYPALFHDNMDLEPGFVDAAGHDFHLGATSPLIDAGAFLTAAVGAGSGTVLPIEDASWFYDGFGIEGGGSRPAGGADGDGADPRRRLRGEHALSPSTRTSAGARARA